MNKKNNKEEILDNNSKKMITTLGQIPMNKR